MSRFAPVSDAVPLSIEGAVRQVRITPRLVHRISEFSGSTRLRIDRCLEVLARRSDLETVSPYPGIDAKSVVIDDFGFLYYDEQSPLVVMFRLPEMLRPQAQRTQPAPRQSEQLPLVASLMSAEGVIQVDQVTDLFGMSKAQLADTTGLSPDNLSKTARWATPKTRTRLTEMLEVISLVQDWAGGPLQAMAWYRAQPIPAFGGRTAEQVVKAGHAEVVRDYLDDLALGGFA